jgi:NAD(P)-dependent dehydrogenase (short-subunit alcohol dehydrogenase family)
MEKTYINPTTPLARISQPIEMAYVISFLANNEEASYITGQYIVADGGLSINMPKPPSELNQVPDKHTGIKN